MSPWDQHERERHKVTHSMKKQQMHWWADSPRALYPYTTAGESKLLAYFYMRINFCLGQTVCQWEDEMIVLLWYVWVVYDTVITSPNAPWEEDAQRHVRVPSSQKQGLSVHNKRDKISSIHTPYPPRTPTVLQPGLTALHCHLLFKSFIYFCLMWMSILHACRHA